MIKLLNYLGFYTKKQYEELKTLKDGLSNKYQTSLSEIDSLYKNKLEKQPHDYDALLLMYGANELNAFFYKMVNKLRAEKELRCLIPRWQKRLNSAKVGIEI